MIWNRTPLHISLVTAYGVVLFDKEPVTVIYTSLFHVRFISWTKMKNWRYRTEEMFSCSSNPCLLLSHAQRCCSCQAFSLIQSRVFQSVVRSSPSTLQSSLSLISFLSKYCWVSISSCFRVPGLLSSSETSALSIGLKRKYPFGSSRSARRVCTPKTAHWI